LSENRGLFTGVVLSLTSGNGDPRVADIVDDFLEANPDKSFWDILDLPSAESDEIQGQNAAKADNVTLANQRQNPNDFAPEPLWSKSQRRWERRLSAVACILSAACLLALAYIGYKGEDALQALTAELNKTKESMARSTDSTANSTSRLAGNFENLDRKFAGLDKEFRQKLDGLDQEFQRTREAVDPKKYENLATQINDRNEILGNKVEMIRTTLDEVKKLSNENTTSIKNATSDLADAAEKTKTLEQAAVSAQPLREAVIDRLLKDQWLNPEYRFEAMEQAREAFAALAKMIGEKPSLRLILDSGEPAVRPVTLAAKVWAELVSLGPTGTITRSLHYININSYKLPVTQAVQLRVQIPGRFHILLIGEDEQGNQQKLNSVQIDNGNEPTPFGSPDGIPLYVITLKDWPPAKTRLTLCISQSRMTFPSPRNSRRLRIGLALAEKHIAQEMRGLLSTAPRAFLTGLITTPAVPSEMLFSTEVQNPDQGQGSDVALVSNMLMAYPNTNLDRDPQKVASYYLGTGPVGIMKLTFVAQ
jgi:hypothetical protein